MKTELVTMYDGITEAERIHGINIHGEKAKASKVEFLVQSMHAGEMLLSQKKVTEHGKWKQWIETNVNEGYDWASEAMRIATHCIENGLSVKELREIGSKRQMILEMRQSNVGRAQHLESPEVPRESRKPAKVKVFPVGQQSVQDDHVVDVNEMVDDDPTPDTPTIRKTADGSQKVKEADKPKTRLVVPEIIEELTDRDPVADWLESHSMADIVAAAVSVLHEDDKKTAAKALRKAADKLDPPDESKVKIPAAGELCGVLPDSLSDEAKQAVIDWAKYKQRHSKKEWRYQTIDSWRKDVKRMENAIRKRGENRVIEMLTQAESTGWRHWDHDTEQDNPFTNGKGNGNGHKTSSTDDFIARNSAKLKATFGCD